MHPVNADFMRLAERVHVHVQHVVITGHSFELGFLGQTVYVVGHKLNISIMFNRTNPNNDQYQTSCARIMNCKSTKTF